MGMMDNMTGMDDAMRARFEELKSKEDSGELDESGRVELQQIRDKMNT